MEPMHRFPHRSALVAATALALLVAAGCTATEPVAETTTDPTVAAAIEEARNTEFDAFVGDAVDLDGVELWVGSPEGAEGDATDVILAEITIAALEAAGADVVDKTEMGPGFLVRDSLLSGEIDLYWEGIGEAWTAILRQPAEGLTAEEIHTQLSVRDLQENGVVWFPPAAFDDGPRFAVAIDAAEEDGISSLSDLGHAVTADETGLICVTTAFTTYPADGRVAVEEALGVTLPDDAIREYEPEPIYPETGDASCRFGLVDSSSGRIPEYDLTVLVDDVGAFLPNAPAPAVREDVIREHPQLAVLLDGLASRLTPDVIQDLNHQVVLEGADPAEAARDWLEREGLVPPQEDPSVPS